VAGELVEVAGGAADQFIGRGRRGEGRGAVEVGRRARRPLMALGAGVVSRSDGAILGGGTGRRDGSGRAERRAGHPMCAWSVWAHRAPRVPCVGAQGAAGGNGGAPCVALLASGRESSVVEAGERGTAVRLGRQGRGPVVAVMGGGAELLCSCSAWEKGEREGEGKRKRKGEKEKKGEGKEKKREGCRRDSRRRSATRALRRPVGQRRMRNEEKREKER